MMSEDIRGRERSGWSGVLKMERKGGIEDIGAGQKVNTL